MIDAKRETTKSTTPKYAAIIPTTTNTTNDVDIVAVRVGQLTLLSSSFTSE